MSKVILITGASSGFGKLTAATLLEQGYTVYPAARRVERMEDLKGQGAHPLKMDVTDDASVGAGVRQVIEDQGRIDVLVNNAGYAAYGMVECTDLKIARRQFDVNVFGAARMIQAVLPHMRNEKSGHIINVSSVVGKISGPMFAWYAGSKHALEAISDALRAEVRGFGIHVSIIEPGAFKTGFDDVALEQLDAVDHAPAYAENVEAFKKAFTKMYRKAPSPEPVVRAIVSAVAAKKPRTRYPVHARTAIIARHLLGDRTFDKIMNSMLGIK